MFWTGLLVALAGLGLQLWAARRAFYRRNFAGMEEFAGFRWAVLAHFGEGALRLIGGCMIIMGGIVAVTSWMFF